MMHDIKTFLLKRWLYTKLIIVMGFLFIKMGASHIFGSPMWNPEVKLTTWYIAENLYVNLLTESMFCSASIRILLFSYLTIKDRKTLWNKLYFLPSALIETLSTTRSFSSTSHLIFLYAVVWSISVSLMMSHTDFDRGIGPDREC